LIAAGVNAKALSTYLGDSSIQITLDRYGHLMTGNKDEAVALVERVPRVRDSGFRLEIAALVEQRSNPGEWWRLAELLKR